MGSLLLSKFNSDGYWDGRLSSSALATSVAVFALSQSGNTEDQPAILNGLKWLANHINTDGGWGDSPESGSNFSTTFLVWCALTLVNERPEFRTLVQRAERWLEQKAGSLDPSNLVQTILDVYGRDRTFSAPILLMGALAGRLGNDPDCWARVPQLPFELALLPHSCYRLARFPVVSYALPALIAVGLAVHARRRKKSLPGVFRKAIVPRVMRILERVQPANGGFLEAAPLTAFVAMSVAAGGFIRHPVVQRGRSFLLESQRESGGWPIDTHLATWVTTLAVQATRKPDGSPDDLGARRRAQIRRWLLKQQYRERHVFTSAPPGGWSWTPLPGGVPDADDTAGGLLALWHLGPVNPESLDSALAAMTWLMDLQNRDGGFPTFCKGWGRLPFDRSCPDITAHVLRALRTWRDLVTPSVARRVDRSLKRGVGYLLATQRLDGAWLPLWFGNQHTSRHENPTYGTAQVLRALQATELWGLPSVGVAIEKGRRWLESAQNRDGGWGGDHGAPSSPEETGLALGALAVGGISSAVCRGAQWLVRKLRRSRLICAAPIGLYFASLWYSEELYPVIFSLSGLRAVRQALEDESPFFLARSGESDGLTLGSTGILTRGDVFIRDKELEYE